MINRLLTRNYKKVPLLFVLLDYPKFLKDGVKDSCTCTYHPAFKDDETLKQKVFDLIDYIRSNYDMKEII